MPEEFLNSCKASLSNLIASDAIQKAEDPLASFSEAIVNFFSPTIVLTITHPNGVTTIR